MSSNDWCDAGNPGRIDLYRRGSFVLEAKQSRERVGGEKFMAAAQGQLSMIRRHRPPRNAAEAGRADGQRASPGRGLCP
jgi:hypothetical protein